MHTLKLYTETKNKRKIKVDNPIVGGDSFTPFDEEMVQRGFYKKIPFQIMEGGEIFYEYEGNLSSISEKTDKNIRERRQFYMKEYAIENLSLLSLIESVLVETSEIDIEVDTLKIEILLLLFHNNETFTNSEDLLEVYREHTPSISEPWHFFPVLQGYLFDIGKMLVEELQHDFLLNKEFGGDIKLTPTQGYDEIYEYFMKGSYYYLKKEKN
jgi:hypothetical protein